MATQALSSSKKNVSKCGNFFSLRISPNVVFFKSFFMKTHRHIITQTHTRKHCYMKNCCSPRIGVKSIFNQKGSFLWQVRVRQEDLGVALFLLIRFNVVF